MQVAAGKGKKATKGKATKEQAGKRKRKADSGIMSAREAAGNAAEGRAAAGSGGTGATFQSAASFLQMNAAPASGGGPRKLPDFMKR